jgi:hypothetical protein
VADDYQRCRIRLGARRGAGRRCAAGITEINALVARDNSAAVAVIRRGTRVSRPDRPDLSVRAAIASLGGAATTTTFR